MGETIITKIIEGGYTHMQEQQCKACQGYGMQSDDEGWQYECSVCHGTGKVSSKDTKVLSVDENNRLLD